MRLLPSFCLALVLSFQVSAAPNPLVVQAADGAYPLAVEVGWRFEQRAAIPTQVRRTTTRDAVGDFCARRSAWVLVARPMLRAELDACASAGRRFVEIPFALDAVILVTTRLTAFRNPMTQEKLAQIWQEDGSLPRARWPQIDPVWPDTPVALAAPEKGSSVFDYLERNVVRKPLRRDYTSFADPDQIAMYVAYKRNWMGLIEYSYFGENRNKLYPFPFSSRVGEAPVAPTPEAIAAGRYPALVKPLLLYIDVEALADPALERFAATLLDLSAELYRDELSNDVHYVPLSEAAYASARARLAARKTGSRFEGELAQGARLLELLTAP